MTPLISNFFRSPVTFPSVGPDISLDT